MAEETVPLYNVNDGLGGRNGGPYLDEELHRRATMDAARREGREFKEEDLINGSPAIQLVTPQQLINAHRDASPSSVEINAKPVGEVKVSEEIAEANKADEANKTDEANVNKTKSESKPRTSARKPASNRKSATKPAAKSAETNAENKTESDHKTESAKKTEETK